MKLFQDLNAVNPTQGTTFGNYAAYYAIYNATNKTTLDSAFTNNNTANPGVTAVVVGQGNTGNQDIWGTKDTVPVSGLCSGTTKFTKLCPVTPGEPFADGNLVWLSGSGS
jgi:hypothetical protein